MATKTARVSTAFINLPYAKSYEKVYLAFIAGVAGYGLVPTAAVRDPTSNYQLERIFNLIAEADYSFHDLSWMALDRNRPRTPRLNMAFELGLAIAMSKCRKPEHQWFVFDTQHLLDIYRDVETMARTIKVDYSDDLFETRPFADLAYVANASAHAHIPSLLGR